MISRRVDLTENQDFGKDHINPIRRFIADDMVTQDVMGIYSSLNDNFMTNEEYELLIRVEKIFGRKRHYTNAIDVFKTDEAEWIYKASSVCARCGAPLLPWNRKGDMCTCDKCNEIIYGRIPWKQYVSVSERIRDAREILHLR